MPRLLVIVPMTGLTPEDLRTRHEVIQTLAGPQYEVDIRTVSAGPPSIESAAEEQVAGAAVAQLLATMGSHPADGVIVWCAGDPGVVAARELVDCPVVGPGEAAIRMASLLAGRFGIITPLPEEGPAMRRLVQHVGLSSQYVGSHPAGLPVLELRADLDATLERIVAAGRVLIDRGAEAVTLGCMALFGLSKAASERLGVPVLDPAACSVQLSKMLIEGGYSFSRLTYPSPPKPLREQVSLVDSDGDRLNGGHGQE